MNKMSGNPSPHSLSPLPTWLRVLRAIGKTISCFILALLTLWAAAALYVDFRIVALRVPVTLIYVLGILAILLKVKQRSWAAVLCFAGFCCVLAWWLSLKPSNEGNWQADADRTAWAEIDGDRVTIHNLRNCEYRTETDYANCWSDRTVHLSQIRAADLFLTNWGIRFASHPIVSFQFGDNMHVAFSIEIGASHKTDWTGTIAKAIQAFGHLTKADVLAGVKFKSSKTGPVAKRVA